MGFLSNLFGNTSSETLPVPVPVTGMQQVRSAPIVERPRYFNEGEANALSSLAKQKATDARQTVRAYNHLTRIEESDTRVHRSHRRYQVAVAENDVVRQKSDARLQRKMQQLRPERERLTQGVETARMNANRRIAELKEKMGA